MSLILNGTDGLSDVDGSASTPAIRGTDANTGIFFPAADTIAFSEGGTEVVRIDSSGNVGIGTASPTGKLEVTGGQLRVTASSASSMFLVNPSTTYADGIDIQATYNGAGSFGPLKFTTSGTERMRIGSDGTVFVGATSTAGVATGSSVNPAFIMTDTGNKGICTSQQNTDANFYMSKASGYSSGIYVRFYVNNSQIGKIETNGSSTSYVTSSDYRLKEDVAPMTDALAKVALLKPVTYKWKADGSASEGFIAHELAEVCPDAVSGEKDALNKDGDIEPQGIDTSFLVATLTAAIQELNVKIEAQALEIATLKGK